MIRPNSLLIAGAAVIIAAGVACSSADAMTFSGNVPNDFTGSDVITIYDTNPDGNLLPDVGIPLQAPAGTYSGNDMRDVRLFYENGTDTLYVGINTWAIAGDVDGDGDPSHTSAWLSGNSGTDMPDFGGTESFALMFDTNRDGNFDVISGVSATTDLAGFSVNLFDGTVYAPGFAFGQQLVVNTGALYGSPSATQPHLEFTILNFSDLVTDNTVSMLAFVGSLNDDGIGEDFLPNGLTPVDVTFSNLTPPPPPQPSSVPLPGTALLLGTGLFGLAGLTRKKPEKS